MFRYAGYRLGKIRATDVNRGGQMTPDDADEWYMYRIRILEAQNKRLRKWYTSLRESQQREFARSCESATNNSLKFGKLSDDNAKLRELVRDMWDAALHPQLFGDGSHLLRRMCDLGIEVDDE